MSEYETTQKYNEQIRQFIDRSMKQGTAGEKKGTNKNGVEMVRLCNEASKKEKELQNYAEYILVGMMMMQDLQDCAATHNLMKIKQSVKKQEQHTYKIKQASMVQPVSTQDRKAIEYNLRKRIERMDNLERNIMPEYVAQSPLIALERDLKAQGKTLHDAFEENRDNKGNREEGIKAFIRNVIDTYSEDPDWIKMQEKIRERIQKRETERKEQKARRLEDAHAENAKNAHAFLMKTKDNIRRNIEMAMLNGDDNTLSIQVKKTLAEYHANGQDAKIILLKSTRRKGDTYYFYNRKTKNHMSQNISANCILSKEEMIDNKIKDLETAGLLVTEELML